MQDGIRHTFSKNERLCGKTNIEKLLARGKRGTAGCLRYCWRVNETTDNNRVLVSVPKKFFKRAVKRNLLKRRIRESWRKQKCYVSCDNLELLLTYSTKEIMDYADIYDSVGLVISRINGILEPKPSAPDSSEHES